MLLSVCSITLDVASNEFSVIKISAETEIVMLLEFRSSSCVVRIDFDVEFEILLIGRAFRPVSKDLIQFFKFNFVFSIMIVFLNNSFEKIYLTCAEDYVYEYDNHDFLFSDSDKSCDSLCLIKYDFYCFLLIDKFFRVCFVAKFILQFF